MSPEAEWTEMLADTMLEQGEAEQVLVLQAGAHERVEVLEPHGQRVLYRTDGPVPGTSFHDFMQGVTSDMGWRIADEFELAHSTVMRWHHGVCAPLPRLQRMVRELVVDLS